MMFVLRNRNGYIRVTGWRSFESVELDQATPFRLSFV